MDAALDLINSEWWYGRGPDGVIDRLSEPGWLDEFLHRWHVTPARPPTDPEMTQLLALRSLLRRMVMALAGGDEPAAADVAELNRFLGGAAYHRHIALDAAYQLKLTPAERSWTWTLAELAASFGELLGVGEPDRIKLCENPECRWAFYDSTKNRRRRWCDASQCGNVFKVRQFRARQRANATDPARP
jgi:predicted RNA-binding Zn ribbon-like protein